MLKKVSVNVIVVQLLTAMAGLIETCMHQELKFDLVLYIFR